MAQQGHKDLAQKFVNDFIGAGFHDSSTVENDIQSIVHVNPGAGTALAHLVTDPAAIAQFFFTGTGLKQVGDAIGKTIGSIAGTPQQFGGSIVPGLNQAVKDIPGAGSLTDLSGFLSALTQRNTWLRIGEGLLGLILIGIGIAAVTRSTPVGKAAIKAAGTAAKVIPK